ncbi:MAG: hypothetical protein KDI63_17235, partial [Gammaproteobacteria bacterium]|nr:hypothetical protein [Gammaproteobacteria bacterium]
MSERNNVVTKDDESVADTSRLVFRLRMRCVAFALFLLMLSVIPVKFDQDSNTLIFSQASADSGGGDDDDDDDD